MTYRKRNCDEEPLCWESAHSTTEPELRNPFEAQGPVEKITLVTDRDTGRSRGFGFVENGITLGICPVEWRDGAIGLTGVTRFCKLVEAECPHNQSRVRNVAYETP
jgi:RNA recognition motif. (a.k.a. RRM, RBD, or RNP domain)